MWTNEEEQERIVCPQGWDSRQKRMPLADACPQTPQAGIITFGKLGNAFKDKKRLKKLP